MAELGCLTHNIEKPDSKVPLKNLMKTNLVSIVKFFNVRDSNYNDVTLKIVGNLSVQ